MHSNSKSVKPIANNPSSENTKAFDKLRAKIFDLERKKEDGIVSIEEIKKLETDMDQFKKDNNKQVLKELMFDGFKMRIGKLKKFNFYDKAQQTRNDLDTELKQLQNSRIKTQRVEFDEEDAKIRIDHDSNITNKINALQNKLAELKTQIKSASLQDNLKDISTLGRGWFYTWLFFRPKNPAARLLKGNTDKKESISTKLVNARKELEVIKKELDQTNKPTPRNRQY